MPSDFITSISTIFIGSTPFRCALIHPLSCEIRGFRQLYVNHEYDGAIARRSLANAPSVEGGDRFAIAEHFREVIGLRLDGLVAAS
jgi:hypothetical protein